MLIGDVEYENPDQIQSWIADIFFFEPFEQGLEKADDVKVLVEIQTELQTFLTDKVKQLQGE